mmetsp:Transcript_2877/g.4242  ORF Transcript_2877/g.4242 Transcript_2877/m.4242 type:complete len:80 (-) Transcript_2877:47-286(-)
MGAFLEKRYSSRLKDGAVADSLNTVRGEEEDVFEGTKAEAYCIDIAKSAALKQDKFIFSYWNLLMVICKRKMDGGSIKE